MDNRDNRYGGDRWRDRDNGGRYGERGRYGGGWDRDDDDRGFFDRAGDEVRSWFGDEEAERRREQDARRWEREQGYGGGRTRSNRDDDYGYAGYRGTGGGWGNQSGDSWNRDRPGERSGSYNRGLMGGSDYDRDNYDRDQGRGREREHRYGDFSSAGGGGGNMADSWGGSGFASPDNNGRRFDRIDAGSTGTHGVHPMSSPVGGAYAGGGGIMPSGGYRGSSAGRYAQARRSMESGGMAGGGYGRGGHDHDPHYSEWRQRQIESIDRDYDEYRREHQSKFEQEFGSWRAKRGEQRQSMGRATEHMEVVGSDGQHIGTVDKVAGDRIILTKSDPNAGGHHHSIPCSWIESVDDKVTVNKTKDEAMRAWRDEETNRALFERDDQGSEGPHMLNRSFSGTY